VRMFVLSGDSSEFLRCTDVLRKKPSHIRNQPQLT
jgi:hypothetical protein